MNISEILKTKILVLDGAMGTAIQEHNLSAQDFGGVEYEGCNENLILTRPDVIEKIHEEYLLAGCDIIETNTFGSTPLVLDEYGIGKKSYEISKNAALLARRCAEKFSTPDKPRFVAGAIGPTTKAISVTGGISFDELKRNFFVQAEALFDGGVDYFLIETCQDTRNIKAALLGIDEVFEKKGRSIPIAISGTIEPMGTMLAGQTVEALLASLLHKNLLYIGLNCATGPEFMTDHIRSLAKLSPFPIACVPNAGLPDENGKYLETPEMVANVVSRFVESGWINLVGGCCGTTKPHIEALAKLINGKKPRQLPDNFAVGSYLSGIDFLEVTNDVRPVIVGERTNVIGSKKFKTLVCEEKFEEASDIARAQIKNGAQIVDVCLANPDRNELEDLRQFMDTAAKKVRVPFMIDSTDEKVIELALTYSQGKAIINSINLEDGEDRYEKVIPLAKKYGAALVVGTIDDDPNQGMGVSRQRKVEIARRSYDLLVNKYGVAPYDIYWDPLVFPCATGDAQYIGSAVETIEGLRLLKEEFPLTKTVLGISNVSFGLPNAGREVLNSVFLYHCVLAGLDLAIVNSEKLERYASIPENERQLAEDLLYNRGADPIAAFAAHFRTKKTTPKISKESMPLMERLPRYIIEGSKDGLRDDLDEALKSMKPLEIINGPLMNGMDEVGRLFNSNQLIVAEVLQSAEAMKAAVSHLETFMERNESSTKGKIVLATVKGDVHDIGKNLVEIILSNNGFNVINLGIKVPPEQLIQAVREHKPDMVGLSGLLVKSAQQMVVTAADLNKAGLEVPVLVGGAALSSNFVDKQIAPAYSGTVAYASDAMTGLELAKKIIDPDKFDKLKEELQIRRISIPSLKKDSTILEETFPQVRSSTIEILKTVPEPPDYQRHVIRNTPLETIWKYINPLMLYGRHLGIKGGMVRELEAAQHDSQLGDHKKLRAFQEQNPKVFSIWQAVQDLKNEFHNFEATNTLRPSGIYQFFRAGSNGNQLLLETDVGQVELHFPRQKKLDGLCLSDYVRPIPKSKTGLADNVAMFIVSVGKGVRDLSEKYKLKGDFLKSQILQALALESAEAYAELLHSQIRKMWGYPDSIDMTMMQRFQAKYQGKRYSFGYPACPRLDDQTILFNLLKPNDIEVELTDGFMMDPEASVSAIVFHHPQATYFSVGTTGDLANDNRQ